MCIVVARAVSNLCVISHKLAIETSLKGGELLWAGKDWYRYNGVYMRYSKLGPQILIYYYHNSHERPFFERHLPRGLGVAAATGTLGSWIVLFIYQTSSNITSCLSICCQITTHHGILPCLSVPCPPV